MKKIYFIGLVSLLSAHVLADSSDETEPQTLNEEIEFNTKKSENQLKRGLTILGEDLMMDMEEESQTKLDFADL